MDLPASIPGVPELITKIAPWLLLLVSTRVMAVTHQSAAVVTVLSGMLVHDLVPAFLKSNFGEDFTYRCERSAAENSAFDFIEALIDSGEEHEDAGVVIRAFPYIFMILVELLPPSHCSRW